MALLVLAYPRISPTDFEWIKAIRARHDERYFKLVEPHFTLVFLVEGMEQSVFSSHVKQQAAGVKPISFVLRCAMVVEDDSKTFSHVFLVPDEGFSEVVKLHDRLYAGVLALELRLDIDFIPHVGVGNAADARACKLLVDELNAQDFEIGGLIDTLDVVLYEHNQVRTLERIDLQ
jgi:2'-5' RNA ligase